MTDFDARLKELGMLAMDEGTADEFARLYLEALEELTTGLLRGELPIGVYQDRLKTLRAMLHEEVRSLGGTPPARRCEA